MEEEEKEEGDEEEEIKKKEFYYWLNSTSKYDAYHNSVHCKDKKKPSLFL